MAGQESAIPVGTQFAPSLIDLPLFLGAIIEHSGDKDAMQDTVWRPPTRIKDVAREPTRRRGSLPLEAARQYGLLNEKYEATDLAIQLAKHEEQDLYDEFARHILLKLGGLRVVEGAQQMAMDEAFTQVQVTGDSLAEYLTDQGFPVTVHNTAINSMRMWLAKAGVFNERGWDVNAAAKERLLGLDDSMIASLTTFTEEEQAFLLALCRINPRGRFPAAKVRDLGEQVLGRRMPRASLPKLMKPMADAGLLTVESGGTARGKTAHLKTTKAFDAEVLEPFLEHAVHQMDAVLTEYYKMDFTTIEKNLRARDTHVKGQALEAYAIRVMRLLGLRFVKWRARAKEFTGQAEVDAVMVGTMGAVPTRWQVQCKNTPSKPVTLDQVAKEVGLAPLTKATHILVMANSDFTKDAIVYAQEIMRQTPLSIFLVDGREFQRILDSNGGDLASILRQKAHDVAMLPRTGLDWIS